VTTATVGDFLHRLKRGMAADLLGVESDRQLVERVLATRDESALLAILLRHGAMVYQVCRRVLRHPQDAEDAFQATFLVLAQELHALRQRGSLAGWLHGVALRVARKARARAVACRRWESGAARPEAVPPDDLTWGEVRSALDEELSRLPDRWRLPLVLCYLEGRTLDEAADLLGWSKSTLRRRLGQARVALASRLKGRGIAWSAALPAVLASESLTATVASLTCVDSTVAVALAVVNGQSVALAASAKVAALTEGVLATMLVKKLGIVAGALIVLALVTAAVGGQLDAANAAWTEGRQERGYWGPLEQAEGPTRPVALFPLLDQPPRGPRNRNRSPSRGTPARSGAFASAPTAHASSRGGDLPRGGLGGGGPGGGNPPGPGEVKVWDAAKGTEILALNGHT